MCKNLMGSNTKEITSRSTRIKIPNNMLLFTWQPPPQPILCTKIALRFPKKSFILTDLWLLWGSSGGGGKIFNANCLTCVLGAVRRPAYLL